MVRGSTGKFSIGKCICFHIVEQAGSKMRFILQNRNSMPMRQLPVARFHCLSQPPFFFLSLKIWLLWAPCMSEVIRYCLSRIGSFHLPLGLQGSCMLQYAQEFLKAWIIYNYKYTHILFIYPSVNDPAPSTCALTMAIQYLLSSCS